MGKVQQLDPAHTWTELSLALTDHLQMTAVNTTFLEAHRTTDVISFAYPPHPPATDGYAGDVIVNVEQAIEVGPQEGGVAEELALYIAHGCHHLTGADDATPTQRRRMRRIELEWLRQAAERNLIDPILAVPAPASDSNRSQCGGSGS